MGEEICRNAYAERERERDAVGTHEYVKSLEVETMMYHRKGKLDNRIADFYVPTNSFAKISSRSSAISI